MSHVEESCMNCRFSRLVFGDVSGFYRVMFGEFWFGDVLHFLFASCWGVCLSPFPTIAFCICLVE